MLVNRIVHLASIMLNKPDELLTLLAELLMDETDYGRAQVPQANKDIELLRTLIDFNLIRLTVTPDGRAQAVKRLVKKVW